MLFLFRGRHGPMVRIVLGLVMLVVGLLHHGWLIVAVIGAVLLLWGAAGLISARRQTPHGNGRQS
ncbi:hypothetical protein ACIA5C_21070 [Actinoplanes sp. NPDC051343]|uniref:hypothetical protein n=1 Tax=Actinoplanes sp. NPDC051343 TaxID=3363906 RepID=UPI00378FEC46